MFYSSFMSLVRFIPKYVILGGVILKGIVFIHSLSFISECTSENSNSLTDIENRPVVAKGEGVGRGTEWEVGVRRCKLLYIEWTNNKVLLYSTENYIQYPMRNHNGKEFFKKEYIYISLNYFALQQKLTQHCESTILQFKKMK